MQLKSFSIRNYRSFYSERHIDFNFDSHNITAIFGPNGAGKTNFFLAIKFFKYFILYSTKHAGEGMLYEPFLLRENRAPEPTEFSAEMATGKHTYKYTFSILNGKIEAEKLYRKESNSDSYETIFSRRSIRNGVYDNNGFDKELLSSTRDNALVLTRAYETNNPIGIEIFDFLDHLRPVAGTQPINDTAEYVMAGGDKKKKILELLKEADLFIQDVSAIETRSANNPNHKEYVINTSHLVRDSKGVAKKTAIFNMAYHESEGTRRIFELAFPIIDTLEKGNTIYIDDFDNSLHPKECLFIAHLFESERNKNGAHLIINTHCTQLMDKIGYKNILLFGKNNFEETEVSNIPGDSRGIAIEKKYNGNIYGANPRVEV